MPPSSGRNRNFGLSHVVLNLLSQLRVIWLFMLHRISRMQVLKKSGREDIFGNEFSVLKDRWHQTFPTKFSISWNDHHKIKAQWSVWPKWLVLVNFIAKCPCESVSDQVILSWGWAWGGGRVEARSTVKVRIASAFPWRTLCKPLSHYFKFEKFKYGGRGEVSTNWIICARV